MKEQLTMAILLCFACTLWCAEPQGDSPLGALTALVGTWHGEEVMGKDGKMEHFTTVYRLTAGQSALIETMMVGTPHEMITVYTRDQGDFLATHYCILRNQPRMRAKDTLAEKRLTFDFADATGLASPNDAHMHALQLDLADDNHLTQTWTHYDGGKETSKIVLRLTRAP